MCKVNEDAVKEEENTKDNNLYNYEDDYSYSYSKPYAVALVFVSMLLGFVAVIACGIVALVHWLM